MQLWMATLFVPLQVQFQSECLLLAARYEALVASIVLPIVMLAIACEKMQQKRYERGPYLRNPAVGKASPHSEQVWFN